MPEISNIDFWIFEPNLISTLLILSEVVKYDLEESELDLIKYGLSSSSVQKELSYPYQFNGKKNLGFLFARDEENTDIIFIHLSFDEILSSQIGLAIFIVQNFSIQPNIAP